MKKKKNQDFEADRIIDYISAHSSRSYSFRELARKLKIKRADLKNFRRFLRKLAHQGTIQQVEGGVFQWPSPERKRRVFQEIRKKEQKEKYQKEGLGKEMLIEGTLQQHSGGFAFLIPKDKEMQDIFIPPGALGGAMNGDQVLAKIVKPEGQRKAEGQILRILERKTKNIVGVFQAGPSYGKIIPWDKKISIQPIVSTRNFHGATDGMMVEAEVISDGYPPEARVVSLLGFQGEPDLDAKIIISKYGLPHHFSERVLEEAEEVARLLPEDLKGRKDFREWYTVTIDGEKARDFDDAISLSAFKNGNFLLGVHIADVAHYVRQGTALDEEAMERGNSVYFPDLVIPMLPEKLSNEICSLNPQTDRLTMSVVIRLDAQGNVHDYHIYPGVINSNERMTYTAVKSIVEDHDPQLLRRYEPLVDMFLSMKKLALLLMEKRRQRGSIDFDLPEPEILLDLTTGRMTGVIRSERNIAHRIIEEFMLLANEIVATHMARSGLPGIYRVHEPPVAEKIADFAAVAASLGYRLPADPQKITPLDLQKLLSRAAGKPEERFLNVLLLRSMSRARYALENFGHFGLALENYTHFTSPIRRYPDLVVHRILKGIIRGQRRDLDHIRKLGRQIPEIAEHCSMTERRADDAEREFIQLKKVDFMHDKLGEIYDGYITGVAPFGLFVELKEFFVEGLIPLKYMDDDQYVYHEKRHFIKGRRKGRVFRLGDPVRVQVIRVDREKREIDFVLA